MFKNILQGKLNVNINIIYVSRLRAIYIYIFSYLLWLFRNSFVFLEIPGAVDRPFLDCGILVEVLKPVTHRRFFVCHANRCSLCVVSRCDAHIIVTWKRYYLLLRLASRRSNFSLHHCYKAYQLYYYYNILLLKRFFC